MKKATVKFLSTWGIVLLVILFATVAILFIFFGGLGKKIIDSIKAVIKIIEVGP